MRILFRSLVILAFAGWPAFAAGPADALRKPVSVDLRGRSLAEALRDIARQAGTAVEFDDALVAELDQVTVQSEGEPAGRVLVDICRPRGLRLDLSGPTARIVANDPFDEMTVKRQESFKFVEKPTLAGGGDKFTITFSTSGMCDVAVAIEDDSGQILRHVAAGVLGLSAPPPLVWNSTSQSIPWDGKNDKGEYIDRSKPLFVRVSLGLAPRLERTLYWSAKKRAAQATGRAVSFAAAPEGVYVFDGGQAADHLRLFSHNGDYIRTIYPYPADKLKDVNGLIWHEFPQDGSRLPIKPSYQMCTLLSIGSNAYHYAFKDGRYFPASPDQYHKGEGGYASEDVSVVGARIALGANRLGRLTTDGTSGGLNATGPSIDLRSSDKKGFYKATESALAQTLGGYETLTNLRPHRFALSPDGKTVYFTRYIENYALDMYRHNYWHCGVFSMSYEGDAEPTLFAGAAEHGKDDAHFTMPSDVACDSKGRVYVADYGNNRVQVFTPDGKLTKSVPVECPTQLTIDPRNDNLYVFTFTMLGNRSVAPPKPKKNNVLRKFKSADDPKLLGEWDLPVSPTRGDYEQYGEVDFYAEPMTVWISPGQVQYGPRPEHLRPTDTMLLAERDGKMQVVRDFEAEVKSEIGQALAPDDNRQLLSFDPKRQKLFIGEGRYHFQDSVVVDVATGKSKLIKLPFDVEDMSFDSDGLAYLRTTNFVVRYDPVTWREVPFDYGEERDRVTANVNSGRREAKVNSGVALPVNSGWHQGGLYVSPRGHLVVGCLFKFGGAEANPRGQAPIPEGRPYNPKIYPGRVTMAAYGVEYIHVWDSHGKPVFEDAIPGLGTLNGVGIDNQNNLYVLSAAPRVYGGKPHFNFLAGTLLKFQPGKATIISDDQRVPIPLSDRPKRNPDLSNIPGNAWVQNGEWFLGGIGWHGKNHGLGCGCRNTRFALDGFARSFAPEIDRYSVAVLDSNGNVITRIGKYGNVDDGQPMIAEGGPPSTRSIGGDEVSLVHGAYVATQTDQRLFVADIGNYRVVSVKLDYHATERVPVKAE